MDIFWSDFIEPILQRLSEQERQVIVEIGSSSGANTKNILQFCDRTKSFCHIIDPLDIGNYEEIRKLLENNGRHHKTISLGTIHLLKDGNVYLIDGDHNWYTVYHELEEIFQTHIQDKNPIHFPVIFFHDVEWPYSRRDLYYSLDQIPDEFRQPSFPGGLLPAQIELSQTSGINFGMQQAVYSGGAKNGVLTGIEDFIEKYSILDFYNFYIVPGNSGLGCLFPKSRYPQETVDFVKARLTFHNHWKNYIHKYAEAFWSIELARSLSEQKNDEIAQKYNQLVDQYGVRMTIYNKLLAEHTQAQVAVRTLDKWQKSPAFRLLLTIKRLVNCVRQGFSRNSRLSL